MILFSIIAPISREINANELLLSLEQQKLSQDNFEVLFITDNKFDFHFRSKLNLKIIKSPNAHPSAKRNLGAREALGEFLVFLDDDVTLPQDWLNIVQAKIRGKEKVILNGPDFNFTESYLDLIPEILKNHFFSEGTFNRLPKQEKQVGALSISLCNCVIKRQDFMQVGLLNESIHFTLDDTEFFSIAQKMNFQIYKIPQMQVFHQRPKIIFPFLKHRFTRRFFVGLHTWLLPKIFCPTMAFKAMLLSWILIPCIFLINFNYTLTLIAVYVLLNLTLSFMQAVTFKKPWLVLFLPLGFFLTQLVSWLGFTLGLIGGMFKYSQFKKVRDNNLLRWKVLFV